MIVLGAKTFGAAEATTLPLRIILLPFLRASYLNRASASTEDSAFALAIGPETG